MREIRRVNISEDVFCDIFISDEAAALQYEKSMGRPVICVLKDERADISLSRYAVEDIKDIDDALLYKVASRHLHLPLIISQTKRIIIREFDYEDFKSLKEVSYIDRDIDFLGEDEGIFSNKESFYNYVHDAYLISKYGIFAIVEKQSKALVGKIGIISLKEEYGAELSYHIFPEYRNKGYAKEALENIIAYAKKNLEIKSFRVNVYQDNIASINLAKFFDIDIKFI